MIYADDLGLMTETMAKLKTNSRADKVHWSNGLKVNLAKTHVMVSKIG